MVLKPTTQPSFPFFSSNRHLLSRLFFVHPHCFPPFYFYLSNPVTPSLCELTSPTVLLWFVYLHYYYSKWLLLLNTAPDTSEVQCAAYQTLTSSTHKIVAVLSFYSVQYNCQQRLPSTKYKWSSTFISSSALCDCYSLGKVQISICKQVNTSLRQHCIIQTLSISFVGSSQPHSKQVPSSLILANFKNLNQTLESNDGALMMLCSSHFKLHFKSCVYV